MAVKEDVSRKWRKRRRRLRRRVRRAAEIIGILIFVVVLVSAFLKSGGKTSKVRTAATTTVAQLGPAAADVKLTSCYYSNYATNAGLRVTNHSDEELNYVVDVLFYDGPKIFSVAIATTDHLGGGRQVHLMASAVAVHRQPKRLLCQITVIKRFP